jgi:hypothetical protein
VPGVAGSQFEGDVQTKSGRISSDVQYFALVKTSFVGPSSESSSENRGMLNRVASQLMEMTMMSKILIATIVAFSCIAHAQTPPAPMATTVVGAIAPSDIPRTGFTRLRLSLTSDEASANETVHLAAIAVCTSSICYEGGAPSSVVVSSTANGASTSIAELEVPYSDIATVQFKSGAGRGALQGSVVLPEPLKLAKGFQGGEVLVVIQKRGAGYVPVAAASNYFQPAATTFSYNPRFPTAIKLPYDVTLEIPAGATVKPRVFLVGVNDTGDDYPLVYIYPELQLSKPATVQLPLIARPASAIPPGAPPRTPRPQPVAPGGALGSQASAAPPSGPLRVEINATGEISREPQPVLKSKQSSPTSTNEVSNSGALAAAAVCNQYGWCNCANQLAFPENQLIIFNAMKDTGTVYLNWCTTIPPYVHITVTNMADTRERFTIKHSPKVNAGAATDYVPGLPLTLLTSWSPYTQVMMNGFYWEGDEGTAANQYGRADGHVHNFSSGLGDNLVGGGGCEDFPSPPYFPCNTFAPQGNKRVMVMPAAGTSWSWIDNAAAGIISNSLSYVSSSTSIVKTGVCSTDTDYYRWSGVANTSGGRLIFISSTSSGRTTAAELCPVFQAMSVFNAIRLDGGPSAAMVLNGGNLLNPLRDLYFAKYGDSRRFPYALKISYPGW